MANYSGVVFSLLFSIYSNALNNIFIMEASTLNPEQTAPYVFNLGYQSTQADERADSNCFEFWKKV